MVAAVPEPPRHAQAAPVAALARRRAARRPTAELLQEGLQLHQSGRAKEAARLYEQVLAREPDQPAANHLLGVVRLGEGDAEAAVRLISRATRANPRDAQYFANLGAALNAAEQPEDALVALDRALALKPAFPGALSNRGMALKTLRRFGAAIDSYRRAIALQPGEASFHFNLANALAEVGDLDLAIAAYREALRLRPAYPAAMSGLSNVFEQMGRADEAVATITAALQRTPEEPEYHYRLGRARYRLGELEAAAASYRQSLSLRPSFGEAQLHLALMVRHAAADAELEAMQALFGDPSADMDDRVFAGFALGKTLADLGRHDDSLDAYDAVNRLHRQRIRFSPAAAVADLAAAPRPFESAERALSAGHRDSAPIFVVGLPRAGKSTVEAILARHPLVHPAGEQRAFVRLAEQTGLTGDIDVEAVDPQRFTALGAAYVQEMQALARAGTITVDTMPPNFRQIGLIRAALPNARILHCVRAPAEHRLAIYEKYLARPGYEYAFEVGELAGYYDAYRALMQRWHALFPGFVHDVDVAARGGEASVWTQELLDFAGLNWDDGCLAPAESEPELGGGTVAQRRENWRGHVLQWTRRHPSTDPRDAAVTDIVAVR